MLDSYSIFIKTIDFGGRQAYICLSSNFMRDNGIEVIYGEMTGAHEWKVWDAAVNKFIMWALEQ